jgi:ABC-type sugar transport system substrate-binding protein
MKRILILAIAALCCAPVVSAEPMQPRPASEVVMDDLLYVSRAIVVFAPAPEDPYFIRQMEMLAEDNGDLAARDVVLIVDTDPAAKSAVRTMLRPSAFSLVIIDKDGKTALRKPRPWDLREITRAIDKFPSRRDEMLGILPSGR